MRQGRAMTKSPPLNERRKEEGGRRKKPDSSLMLSSFLLHPFLEIGGFAMKCRHCQRVESNRPRGLCWSCYYRPGVRELFPSTSKFARRGLGNGNTVAPLPAT